jgi:hypothetical protein
MKNLILFFILFFIACSPKIPQKMGDYYQLPKKNNPEEWVGKKVTFVAVRCPFEHQHLLKTTLDGTPKYLCLEAEEVGQILAYYGKNTPIRAADALRFRVFGTVGKVSGAGKGGKMHTEYYLDLDYIDM